MDTWEMINSLQKNKFPYNFHTNNETSIAIATNDQITIIITDP